MIAHDDSKSPTPELYLNSVKENESKYIDLFNNVYKEKILEYLKENSRYINKKSTYIPLTELLNSKDIPNTSILGKVFSNELRKLGWKISYLGHPIVYAKNDGEEKFGHIIYLEIQKKEEEETEKKTNWKRNVIFWSIALISVLLYIISCIL